MNGVVYGIFVVGARRVYVGSTVNLPRRWRLHLARLRAGRHRSAGLQAAFAVAGVDGMRFCVLERLPAGASRGDLLRRESWWKGEYVARLGSGCMLAGGWRAAVLRRAALGPSEQRERWTDGRAGPAERSPPATPTGGVARRGVGDCGGGAVARRENGTPPAPTHNSLAAVGVLMPLREEAEGNREAVVGTPTGAKRSPVALRPEGYARRGTPGGSGRR